MGPPEGKSLKIDTGSQNRLNAIKNHEIWREFSKTGFRSHPWEATPWDKVLDLDESYPTSQDLKLVLWLKIYSIFSTKLVLKRLTQPYGTSGPYLMSLNQGATRKLENTVYITK